jgi:hypothetical protein
MITPTITILFAALLALVIFMLGIVFASAIEIDRARRMEGQRGRRGPRER